MRVAALLVIFLFSGCCTKKGCVADRLVWDFYFYSFEQEEVDTIWIYSYVKGSGFVSPKDSVSGSVHFSESAAPGYFSHEEGLAIDDDHLVLIPATSAQYRIENFWLKPVTCNTCFPYTPKDERVLVIGGYQVNGVPGDGPIIRIRR